MNLSYHIKNKLLKINCFDVTKENCFNVFATLKDHYNGLTYQTLYELYNYANNVVLTYEEQNCLIKKYKNFVFHNTVATDNMYKMMLIAENYSKIAAMNNEIPVGAIVVYKENVIGSGYNQTRAHNDIFAHAEILAINSAQKHLSNYRLNECELYTTLEPCVMCSGAIINARIKTLVFGSVVKKTGAVVSNYSIFSNKNINHHCKIVGPIDDKYGVYVSEFMQKLRHQTTQQKQSLNIS